MTSPGLKAFIRDRRALLTRPTLTPSLPPARHLVFRCARCGAMTIRFSQHCTCHPSALMHGHEVDLETYTRLRAAP